MEKSIANANTLFERGKHPMDLLLKQKGEGPHLPRPGDIVEGDVIEMMRSLEDLKGYSL